MVWDPKAPEGNESLKIRWCIVPYTRGKGLDLGCGASKPFAHFTGVDNGHHARTFGWNAPRPDVTVDTCENLSLFATEGWDFVFSSHLLEHIEDFEAALKEWWRVIKDGGFLVLYLPHKELYPNIGVDGANPDHKHDFMPRDISDAMFRVAPGWDLVENETRSEGIEYSFYQVYRKRKDGQCNIIPHRWKPGGKTACVVRYGAFGDMMQSASVLPELKKQGYHVTVMTTPKGHEVLKHDPHIDGWVVQDPDQVPNDALGDYWKTWAKKFDRFINFSESVEGTMLAIPGRINHAWPQTLRHKMMNVNYVEFMHRMAEVPLKPAPRFYPSKDEEVWAINMAHSIGGFRIMWALAGSSIHKAYPHMDNVVAWVLLNIPRAQIILVGDEACQMLEAGWEGEPRVHRMSGKWSIRESLAMAQQCALVVGPETGVLNAVSMCDEVGKIVFMSHSSVENLTRDWANTTSIIPGAPCYPCHRMHYTREYCPEASVPIDEHPISKDEKILQEMTDAGHVRDGMFHTGAALCAHAITPEQVSKFVKVHYERWRTRSRIQVVG